jgi:hypothetical protein
MDDHPTKASNQQRNGQQTWQNGVLFLLNLYPKMEINYSAFRTHKAQMMK